MLCPSPHSWSSPTRRRSTNTQCHCGFLAFAHHIPTRPISKSCRFRLQTQPQSDQPSPSTAPGLTLTILASWMPGALPASPLPRVVLSPNNSQRGLCPWDMKHIFIFLFLSKFIYSKIHFLKWSCSVSCVTTITIRIQRI